MYFWKFYLFPLHLTDLNVNFNTSKRLLEVPSLQDLHLRTGS